MQTVRVGNEVITEDGLCASNEEAPRSLYLSAGGVPLAISRDGRTVFFERERSLWRLDLRKPLPQLLDEVRVPPLPDPPP